MELGSGSAILCIINLLFVPFIALRYYCKRANLKFEMSCELAYRYALLCTLNVLFTEFFVSLLEKFMSSSYTITTGGQLAAVFPYITLFTQLSQNSFSCTIDSRMYTVLALISSFILVLFIELLSKTVSLDVSVEKKQKKARRAGKSAVKESNDEAKN